jgi:hypothetical protein
MASGFESRLRRPIDFPCNRHSEAVNKDAVGYWNSFSARMVLLEKFMKRRVDSTSREAYRYIEDEELSVHGDNR